MREMDVKDIQKSAEEVDVTPNKSYRDQVVRQEEEFISSIVQS